MFYFLICKFETFPLRVALGKGSLPETKSFIVPKNGANLTLRWMSGRASVLLNALSMANRVSSRCVFLSFLSSWSCTAKKKERNKHENNAFPFYPHDSPSTGTLGANTTRTHSHVRNPRTRYVGRTFGGLKTPAPTTPRPIGEADESARCGRPRLYL